jgi:hypothetical protein
VGRVEGRKEVRGRVRGQGDRFGSLDCARSERKGNVAKKRYRLAYTY